MTINVETVDRFKFLCHKIIPLVYDESLSYYEFLCKVMQKLNEVIGSVDNQNDILKNFENEINEWEITTDDKYNAFVENTNLLFNNFMNALAAEYNAELNYTKGNYVRYGTKIYRCIYNTVAGPWNPANWAEITYTNDLYEQLASKMQCYIDKWLSEHPEATTTVQDNSLTESKFSNSLKLLTIKDYVTPQMYGGIGDGVTDDSKAIQQAIDTNKFVILPQGTYKCDKPINIHNGTRIHGINRPTLQFNENGIIAIDSIYYQFVEISNIIIRAKTPINFENLSYPIHDSLFCNLQLYGDESCFLVPQNGRAKNNDVAIFNCNFQNIRVDSNDKGFCNIGLEPSCFFSNITDSGNIKTIFYNTSGVITNSNLGYSNSIVNVFAFDSNIAAYSRFLQIENCNFENISNSVITCNTTNTGFRSLIVNNCTIQFKPEITGITDAVFTIPTCFSIAITNLDFVNLTSTHTGVTHLKLLNYNGQTPLNINVPNDFVIFSTRQNTKLNHANTTTAGFNLNDIMQNFYGIKATYGFLTNGGIEKDVKITAESLSVGYCTCANITSASVNTIYTLFPSINNVTGKRFGACGLTLTLVNKTQSNIACNKLNSTTDYGFDESYTLVPNSSANFILTLNNNYHTWHKIN